MFALLVPKRMCKTGPRRPSEDRTLVFSTEVDVLALFAFTLSPLEQHCRRSRVVVIELFDVRPHNRPRLCEMVNCESLPGAGVAARVGIEVRRGTGRTRTPVSVGIHQPRVFVAPSKTNSGVVRTWQTVPSYAIVRDIRFAISFAG
jgi:hypothetical protein